MFSYLLSAVGVPNISNLSAPTATNNRNKKRNNKAKKAARKKNNKSSNKINEPDSFGGDDEEELDGEDSTVKSEVAEESLEEEEEEDEESEEENPAPAAQNTETALLSGGPIEALMQEVSVRCGVDVSVVFGCMNQLWESHLKYDDAEVLAKAVEEFKKIYTPKGTHKRAPFAEEAVPSTAPIVAASSSSNTNTLPSQTNSTAGAVAASSSVAASTRPAGAPLSIADRLEVAARYSSSSMVDSLTALGSWARVFNQTHRAKATASPSTTGDKCNCAREVFFSSKALAILLTTMLSNLTLRKDQKVRLLFAELIANLAEISSQHAAVTAMFDSLDALANQVDTLTSEAAVLVRSTDSSGVSLLAESVSVCVRRALEVALTSFTPTLSVPQRLEREERRLKEMLDGQSLLAALGQVDALLTSLDSKDTQQPGRAVKTSVQLLFQRRETRLDKLQLLLENMEGIRSVSSQVLSEVRSAQLGQAAPVNHNVDLSSINRLLAQEASSLEARLLADSGLTGESLEVKQQAALTSQGRIQKLQSEHDGQVRQLQEQLSASTVRVSNLVAQRDLLRHQLEAVEKDIQLAQESQEKGRVEMAQKEARFRDQMDQLSQSNQSAAQSLKGHGGLGGILSSVAALEQALLQPFLQPPSPEGSATLSPLPPALVQSVTLTASSGGAVIAVRQRLAEDAFCEYLSAEGDCLRLLMERGRSAQDRMTQLVKEQQAFQDLAMTKLSSETASKIAKLSQEMTEDVMCMRQLLDGVAQALTRLQVILGGGSSQSSSTLGARATERLSSILSSLKAEDGTQASASIAWPEVLVQWWETYNSRSNKKKTAPAATANPNSAKPSQPNEIKSPGSTQPRAVTALFEVSGSGTVASSTREFSLQALLDAAAGGAGSSAAPPPSAAPVTLTPSKPAPAAADGARKQTQSRPPSSTTQSQGQRQPNPKNNNNNNNNNGSASASKRPQSKSAPSGSNGGSLRKVASTSSISETGTGGSAGLGPRRDTSAAIHLLEKMAGANSKAAVPKPTPVAAAPAPSAVAPSSSFAEKEMVADNTEKPSGEPSAIQLDEQGENPKDTTPDLKSEATQGEEEEKREGANGAGPVTEGEVADAAATTAPVLSQVGRTTRRGRRGGKRVKARRLRREGQGQGDGDQDEDEVDGDKVVEQGGGGGGGEEKDTEAAVDSNSTAVDISAEQSNADLPSEAVSWEISSADTSPPRPPNTVTTSSSDDLTFCTEDTVVFFDQSHPNLAKLLSPGSPRCPRWDDSCDTSTSAAQDEPEDVQTDLESSSDSATKLKLKLQWRDDTLTSATTTPMKELLDGEAAAVAYFQSPFVDMGEVYPHSGDGDPADGIGCSKSSTEDGPFPFESNPALSSLSGNFSKKIEESLEEKKPSAVIQQFSDGILRETEPTTS